MHVFAVIAHRDHAELARAKVRAAQQFAVQDKPAANAGADSHADEGVVALARATPHLAERRAVGVIFHRDRQRRQLAEKRQQITAVEKLKRARFRHMAGAGVDIAGETDADARNLLLLLVLFDYRAPGVFKGFRIIVSVIFIAGKFFALFGYQAVFDMGAAYVEANKFTHGFSLCDQPGSIVEYGAAGKTQRKGK